MAVSTSEGFGKAIKIRAASEALTSQLGTLTRVIDPLMMTIDLISVKIIDRSLLEKVRLSASTRSEKACDVLTAVSASVETNPDFFTTFCDILDKEPVTKEIAKTLKGRKINTNLAKLSMFCLYMLHRRVRETFDQ